MEKISEQDFKSFEMTGEMEVFLDKVMSKFNNDCTIYQYHEKFTLHQLNGIRCCISKIQAIQLIDLLKLFPVKTGLFKNATSWRLENIEK